MIEIGRKPDTNEPVCFPTGKQTGIVPHIGIFGGPGCGKSFLLKKEIADFAAHSDTKTFIIGAKPEYQQLANEAHIELFDLYSNRNLTTEQIIERYSAFPKSRLYIDQEDHVTPQMLHEIMRPARMHGCKIIYAVQSIWYNMEQYAGYAAMICDNTGSFILLYHSKENRATEYKRFQLTESEDSFFSEWNRGLLITKSQRIPFITSERYAPPSWM
ncbi:MAG: hypothetical protein IKG82_04315 [Oscillospiraceae bacterium]|nr:hypothetical protein [Oscillospiraceae bacterium]